MSYLIFFLSSLLGFTTHRALTVPGTKINKRLPRINLKIIQISPTIRIFFKKRTFHLHHWMSYSIILIVTITVGGVFDNLFSKGFLVGGILQGLTFTDWKQIIKRVE